MRKRDILKMRKWKLYLMIEIQKNRAGPAITSAQNNSTISDRIRFYHSIILYFSVSACPESKKPDTPPLHFPLYELQLAAGLPHD